MIAFLIFWMAMQAHPCHNINEMTTACNLTDQGVAKPSPSFHAHTSGGITSPLPCYHDVNNNDCTIGQMQEWEKDHPKIPEPQQPSECATLLCTELKEYPAIQEEFHEDVHFDGERFSCIFGQFNSRFDEKTKEFVRWCEHAWRYTCKSPDSEVLEFTVSGKAFCRKVN